MAFHIEIIKMIKRNWAGALIGAMIGYLVGMKITGDTALLQSVVGSQSVIDPVVSAVKGVGLAAVDLVKSKIVLFLSLFFAVKGIVVQEILRDSK